MKAARRTWVYWCEKLSIPEFDIPWQENLWPFYEQRRSEASDAEAAAAVPASTGRPIPELQQEILAVTRAGMIFFNVNKERGTHLKIDGKSFARLDYGENSKLEVFSSDDAMLASLRACFDLDSWRGAHPHRPPEREIWQYNQSHLMKPDISQPTHCRRLHSFRRILVSRCCA